MTLTELLAWLCANNEQTALNTWKASYLRRHPDCDITNALLTGKYYTEPAIADYWKSDLGKLNRAIVLFWLALKNPRLTRLWWRIRYEWRSLVRRKGVN